MQLIEIHDQPWFPTSRRDDVTDALQLLLNLVKVYRPIVPRLRHALEESGTNQILDLCSGAGGPWPWLSQSLQRGAAFPVDIALTDKYPHNGAFHMQSACGRLHFSTTPVDATQVPADLGGFRTLFTSFHHFAPPEARGIIQDAVDEHQGIAIFEAPGRHVLTILLVCLIPLVTFLVVPFMRPFRWSRLVWTYLLPVIPFVLFFDGIVSCLRVYSPPELRELVAGLSSNNYKWEIGMERGGLLHVPIAYLIGHP